MRLAVVAIMLAVAVGGCGAASVSFCERAADMAERLERGDFDPTSPEDMEAFADDMDELAQDAPGAVRRDLQEAAGGLRSLSEGDVSVATDPDFGRALERFGRYARRRC